MSKFWPFSRFSLRVAPFPYLQRSLSLCAPSVKSISLSLLEHTLSQHLHQDLNRTWISLHLSFKRRTCVRKKHLLQLNSLEQHCLLHRGLWPATRGNAHGNPDGQVATRKTYSKTWGLAVPILYTLLGGMRLTRGRIEKMQQNYVWYAHPPKNMQKMLWEEKSKKKNQRKIYRFLFCNCAIKNGSWKMQIATCRNALGDWCRRTLPKIMRENWVWNVLRKKRKWTSIAKKCDLDNDRKKNLWTIIAKNCSNVDDNRQTKTRFEQSS